MNENVSKPRLRDRLSSIKVAFLTIVLVYLPFLVLHAQHLWQKPHYQFFPLLLAGIAWQLWSRRELIEWQLRWTLWACRLATVILAVAVLSLVASMFWYSPWLAMISAMLLVGAGLIVSSPSARYQLFPLWAATWLLIPLPFQLDNRLVQAMQHGVSRHASEQLDLFEIDHLPLGTTLVFPDKQLLVEEACSGVRSLFALIACVALCAIWVRIGILPLLVMFAAAMIWAYLANVLRVICIAAAYDAMGVDLSVGWLHEVLGTAVFLLALGLMASTFVLVRSFFAPVERWAHQESLISGTWNWLVAGQRIIKRNEKGELVFPGQRSRRTVYPNSDPSVQAVPHPGVMWAIIFVFATLFVVELGVAGKPLRSELMAVASQSMVSPYGRPVSQIVTKSLLPEHPGEWELVDYEMRERPANSESPYSNIWRYKAASFAVSVSLDYPYSMPHDLSVCYRGIGWTIESQRVENGSGKSGSESRWHYQIADCLKPLGPRGLLVFSVFDSAGNVLKPPLIDMRNFATMFADRLTSKVHGDGVYQVQMFVTSDHRLTRDERAEAIKQFVRLREIIRERWAKEKHDS